MECLKHVYRIFEFLKQVETLATKKVLGGTSLVVQWLRLRTPNAGGPRFDPWSGN